MLLQFGDGSKTFFSCMTRKELAVIGTQFSHLPELFPSRLAVVLINVEMRSVRAF